MGAGGSAVIAEGTARVYIAGVAGVDGTLILRFLRSRAGCFLACFGQRAAAMATPHRAGGVVGATVGAGRRMSGFGRTRANFGFPFKPGRMLGLVHAGANLLPAGPVVGGAAIGADDNIVIIRKFLFTNRTVVASVTCHEILSSQ